MGGRGRGIALVIGGIGGVIGRKTAEVVDAFTTSKVTLSTTWRWASWSLSHW